MTALASRLASDRDRSALAPFQPTTYDAQTRTVDVVMATETPVERYGYAEVLSIQPRSWDTSRAENGGIPVLDSHQRYSTEAILGRVVGIQFKGGRMLGTVAFADTDAGRRAEGMVARGELPGVSIGYRILAAELTGDTIRDQEVVRVTQAELLEVSLVSVPADPNSAVRSISERGHPMTTAPVATAAPAGQVPAPNNAQIPPATGHDQVEAQRRAQDIRSIGLTARIDDFAIETAVRGGMSVDDFRSLAFEHLAAQTTRNAPRTSIIRDEGETRQNGMIRALAERLGAPRQQGGPQDMFRGLTHLDMAARSIGWRGPIGSVADREEILTRAFHSTSDFPIIFQGAINAASAARYEAAPVSYRAISTVRNVGDFRPQQVIRGGDFPTPQPVGEAGEIKFGTFGEGQETIAVAPYAVQFNISRQMLINDNLGALDQVLSGHGTMVAIFEERLFYAFLLSNGGAGPTMGDTVALFHASHGNLAGAGTAITNAALGAGRASMRKQKGLPSKSGATDGLELNIAPKYLVVGPDKETEAETILAAIAAAQASNANIFSGKLEPVVSAQITGNQWFLFGDPAQFPALCAVRLDGYTSPRLRLDDKFGVQGLGVSLEHDFGVGALDWRPAYRNPGA